MSTPKSLRWLDVNFIEHCDARLPLFVGEGLEIAANKILGVRFVVLIADKFDRQSLIIDG